LDEQHGTDNYDKHEKNGFSEYFEGYFQSGDAKKLFSPEKVTEKQDKSRPDGGVPPAVEIVIGEKQVGAQ